MRALVLGLPHEPPIAAVTRALSAMRVSHATINQRHLITGNVRTSWSSSGASGAIEVEGTKIDLEQVSGVYTRLTTWSDLPEVKANPESLSRARDIHKALEAWLETTSAAVINRTSANDTNNSKPYQAMIIRNYFDIPATLVTNDPDAVLAFSQEFDQIIYKSVSGERSIVTILTDADLDRLHLLAHAPVQFQEYVTGVDVRVHIVGQEVFAASIESDSVDYRYDCAPAFRISPVRLPDPIASQCLALTARLGLLLSGIDLRYANDGRVVCFEVNPSPAFSVYEHATGQPIAEAIARVLAGTKA